MDRFYVPNSEGAARLELPADEARHLAVVLRKRVGDEIEVFDGSGSSAIAVVEDLPKRGCVVRIDGGWQTAPPGDRSLVVASAIPKGDRARFFVEKLTELGVDRLIPLETTRSVVSPRDSKLEKLRQTVVAACKQSGRNWLMTIDRPTTFDDLIESRAGRLLVADRTGVPPSDLGVADSRTIAIGPEGGFTDDELAAARDAGATFVALGRHVLRIETAAIAAAALLV